MNELERKLRAAIGTEGDELEQRLRRAIEGVDEAAPGGALATDAETVSGPTYGLNSAALNQDLAARLGSGTTIDGHLNN